MKVLITQPNYIPWRGYFYAINLADVFVVYDDVQYTRRDWRNRNLIKTPIGLQWLTIPVQTKGKYLQKINETAIADPHWAARHWKTLHLNYAKAPHFATVASVFENLYQTMVNQTLLTKVNLTFITAICNLLYIKTPIVLSSQFELKGTKSEKLAHICKQLGATEYLSGKAAMEYLDVDLFSQLNISVTWLQYNHLPPYRQLYPPFEPHVTVLDLLFNEGNQAHLFI